MTKCPEKFPEEVVNQIAETLLKVEIQSWFDNFLFDLETCLFF
jgi:hypothetical protein